MITRWIMTLHALHDYGNLKKKKMKEKKFIILQIKIKSKQNITAIIDEPISKLYMLRTFTSHFIK